MSYNLSKRSLERLEGIEDVLLYIIRLGITDSPHDFGIPQLGGLRTAEDQNKLYQQGRELPGCAQRRHRADGASQRPVPHAIRARPARVFHLQRYRGRGDGAGYQGDPRR